MTIDLVTLDLRSPKRARVFFSASLGAGAFGRQPAIAGLYTLTSRDALGASPQVLAAQQIVGSPACAELVLCEALVEGGIYDLTVGAVPAADGSTTAPSTCSGHFGETFRGEPYAELTPDDLEAMVFGIDLVWTGRDFAESTDGDLALVSGLPNAKQAVDRRYESDGLPWQPSYGAKPRGYVDGARSEGSTLAGALVRQGLADDRVRSVTVRLQFDEQNPEVGLFAIQTLFRGARAPVETKVPIANR